MSSWNFADNVDNVDNVHNVDNVDDVDNVDNVDNVDVDNVDNIDNVDNVNNVDNDFLSFLSKVFSEKISLIALSQLLNAFPTLIYRRFCSGAIKGDGWVGLDGMG